MNERPAANDASDEARSLWNDPVVEEVRAIRRRLWDAAGRDVHRFIEQTRQGEARRDGQQSPKRGAS
jgi:hypothetical protein